MSGLEGTAEGQRLAGNRRRGHPGPDLCSQEFWSSDSGPAHLALGRSLSSAPRQLQVLGHLVLSSSPCLTSPIPNHSRHAADSALREAPVPGFPPQPLSCSPAPDSWTHLPFNGPASELSLTPRGLLRSLPLTNTGVRGAWRCPRRHVLVAPRQGSLVPVSEDFPGQTFQWVFRAKAEGNCAKA